MVSLFKIPYGGHTPSREVNKLLQTMISELNDAYEHRIETSVALRALQLSNAFSDHSTKISELEQSLANVARPRRGTISFWSADTWRPLVGGGQYRVNSGTSTILTSYGHLIPGVERSNSRLVFDSDGTVPDDLEVSASETTGTCSNVFQSPDQDLLNDNTWVVLWKSTTTTAVTMTLDIKIPLSRTATLDVNNFRVIPVGGTNVTMIQFLNGTTSSTILNESGGVDDPIDLHITQTTADTYRLTLKQSNYTSSGGYYYFPFLIRKVEAYLLSYLSNSTFSIELREVNQDTERHRIYDPEVYVETLDGNERTWDASTKISWSSDESLVATFEFGDTEICKWIEINRR